MAVVKNIGDGDAGGFSCNLEINGDVCGRKEVLSLNAGEQKIIHFYQNLSRGVEYFANISVDKDGMVEEKDENNNYKSVRIFASLPHHRQFDWKIVFLATVGAAAVLSVAAIFLKRKKDERGVKIEPEEEVKRCFICLGKIKQGSPFVMCSCGAIFHRSCAERVGKCPNCGKELKEN